MINPGLSNHKTVQAVARYAERLGLHLTHYNSGSRYNELNGYRLFLGTEPRDYFAGNHLTQQKDIKSIDIYLQGFEAGLENV